MRRVLAALFLMLITSVATVTASTGTPSATLDATGCDDIGPYMYSLHDLAESVYADHATPGTGWTPEALQTPTPGDNGNISKDELLTMSPGDLRTLAAAYTDYVNALREIEPPAWLQDWQDARITYLQGLANFLNEGAQSGLIPASLLYGEALEAADATMEAAQSAVIAQCPSFLDWLTANDLLSDIVDATGTPTT